MILLVEVHMKKAFTLIELLVVIAIIAILAAILFPVFAQAKLQAKKTSSLSNIKQIALSEIMYQGDYDDNFVLSTQDYANSGCTNGSVTSDCISGLPTALLCWPVLLQPYIKSYSIYVDPGTGDPQGVFSSGGPSAIPSNWNNDAQYGYNYQFLSPMVPGGSNGDQATGHIFALSRQTSTAVHPAQTVMFSTAQSYASATSASVQFTVPDDNWANPPGAFQYTLPAPDRVVIVNGGCFAGTAPLWTCGWVNLTPSGYGGPISANVRVFAPYQGGNFAWVDGHAKAFSAGAIAAGTDFATSTPSDGQTTYGPTGAVINNVNNYLWTLDGTLTDIK